MAVTFGTATRATLLSMGIAALAAAPAAAQTPTPVPSVTAMLAKAIGKTVRVTTVDGKEQKGRLSLVTPPNIALDGKPVSLEQVSKVETVKPWILKSALIGIGSGAAAAVTAGVVCEAFVDPMPGYDNCWSDAAIYGALAGGAGFAVTALVLHRPGDLLYSASKSKTTFAIAPIVSPTRKGIAVRVSWH